MTGGDQRLCLILWNKAAAEPRRQVPRKSNQLGSGSDEYCPKINELNVAAGRGSFGRPAANPLP
jgi:hypothetical protein